MNSWSARNGKRLIALTAIVLLAWLTRLPTLPTQERAELAEGFKFVRTALPEIDNRPARNVRDVHPDLHSLRAWISAVGAAVALNDLDGDGLDNDVCYVDTRRDQIIVAPVPGTGDRFAPFELTPRSLPFDPSTTAPMGCVPADMNEDGRLDLLAYYWGRTPIAFIRRGDDAGPIGADSFAEVEIMPSVERWFTNAVTFADLDGDTHVDLIVCNYFPDGADVLNPKSTEPQTMQDSMSRAYNGGRKHVFRWSNATRGASPSVTYERLDGLFDDQVDRGWALGVGAADLDGDGLPELYFAHDFGPDRLMHNRSSKEQIAFARLDGVKTFTMPNSKVLGRDSYKGMSVDFGDLNGDGLLDIYVSNIAKEFALEESHFAFVSTGRTDLMKAGIAPYCENSEPLGLSRSGWGWDTRLADFNNNGVLEALQATGFLKGEADRWPELHELAMANDQLVQVPGAWAHYQPGWDVSGHEHNPFFVRASDGRFYDIAPDIGLGDTYVTRGIATADVDGDGDLDFVIANQWEPSFVFRNDSPGVGRFLALRIGWPVERVAAEAAASIGYRAAVGAFVTLHLPDGRQLVSIVDGGNGHSGNRSHEVHFGLGSVSADAKLRVEIRRREGGAVRVDSRELPPGRHTILLEREKKQGT